MERSSLYELEMMKIVALNFAMPLPSLKITWPNSTISGLLVDLEEVCPFTLQFLEHLVKIITGKTKLVHHFEVFGM